VPQPTPPPDLQIDERLVRRLIAHQFPQWAGLELTRVPSAGTDNTMFRLGNDLVVRLPRIATAAADALTEQQWLPRLAALLPIAIPVPVGNGMPGDGYPYPWLVCRWLDGHDATDAPIADLHDAAMQLGRFVATLRRFDGAGGPESYRGGPVSTREHEVRAAIRDLGANDLVDADVAAAAWQTALAAPRWDGPPVWVHGDLHPANLLVRHGRLAAVIDFGVLGVGDPACDMLPAWTLLTAQSREWFRAEADVDDATWLRGRGWGLSFGLGAQHVYRSSNPVLGAIGRHAMTEAIADYQANG